MNKNFLLEVAICFVCSMSLLISSTHVFDERQKTPVFSTGKTERSLPPKSFPHITLPKNYKDFFSQFAP